MTKVIGTARVLPTATADGAVSIQHPDSVITHRIPLAGLPACPAWCDGRFCVGGETSEFDGVSIDTDRLHEHNLTQMLVADGDSTRDKQDVRLFIERLDTLDAGEPPMVTRVQLEIERHGMPRRGEIDVAEATRGVSDWHCRSIAAQALVGSTGPRRLALTSAELRDLARAALEAADLQDAADAAEGR